jgi:hypothetical protein
MTTREQAIAFLRSLKAGDEGATIYQDVIDHVLAALTEAERSERSALDSVDSLMMAVNEFSTERAALRHALQAFMGGHTKAEVAAAAEAPCNGSTFSLGAHALAIGLPSGETVKARTATQSEPVEMLYWGVYDRVRSAFHSHWHPPLSKEEAEQRARDYNAASLARGSAHDRYVARELP